MDDRALARYFADLAETLLSVTGVAATMKVLAEVARRLVEGRLTPSEDNA